ncbi:Protein F37C4.5 [Caenorhabditis elegans]|uniref:Protein F37C4.5 n=2 Tax=Caenorhabditis elegans TaxID=6239 RepID=F37C4_CAEEL|nr:Protein F37C4.5 [Caenorhabditis elegans]O44400.3 RecName: Full=Protein F37C4.5 [Caenorhabditis elegans]CCD70196.1 Protein F37C4.5 [Caenorhabditis elegans]|eukprot:NP_001023185.1 Protein F37C4.5 [Caenorhabditis elegans]
MAHIVQTHKLTLHDVAIDQALVYSSDSNCAELKRTFQVELAHGYNEVKVQNLPFDLVQDSIRVSGAGEAVIHDVSVKNQEGAEFVIPERVLAIKAIFEEKERAKDKVADSRVAVQKRIEGLDNLITEVAKHGKDGAFHFDGRTIESLNALHGFHQDTTVDLRAQIRTLDQDLRKAEEEYARASQDYDNTGYRWRNSAQYASIIVESEAGGAAQLTITYQVNNVSWTPFYDIRVTAGVEAEMHVTYFGKVRQYSGEDWKTVPLVLSTARPAHGVKQLPKLGALEASIVVPEPECNRGGRGGYGGGYAQDSVVMACAAPMMEMGRSRKSMKMSYAAVKSSNIASEFSIGRPATIDDRTDEYKVNIGQFTLDTKLSNVTVPSRNATAFLVANSVNTSDYPLVAGQASIFLDGAFVNKTEFEDAVVSQKFEVSLGVDPNIRIEYKPVRNYQEQSGTVEKINSQVTEKTTAVTNLRPNSVLLTIREQLPRSTDSRIKVHLNTPEAVEVDEASVEPTVGAAITPEKILDYTVQLAPGQSSTFVVKYTTEHPQAEQIRYEEKF